MKFICLGYADENKWEAMSQSEQDAMIEECSSYDDLLKNSGHWTGVGEALQSSLAAKTLRRVDGKLTVTDGPYAETKEQLGGFGVLEAEDMNQAIELMSKHPSLRFGPFEFRPVDEELAGCGQAAAAATDKLAEGVKFICLGYWDEKNWNAMSQSEREARLQKYAAYGETLSQRGRWVGGTALKSAKTAKTLRSKGGTVLVTDGPYAETKEQLGGVAIFRFRDMERAIESWSNHPCLCVGSALELRAADEEFNARVAAREVLAERK